VAQGRSDVTHYRRAGVQADSGFDGLLAPEERIGVDVSREPVGNQVGLVPAQLGEAAVLAQARAIAVLERLAVADEDDVSGDGLRRSRASLGSRSPLRRGELCRFPPLPAGNYSPPGSPPQVAPAGHPSTSLS
jgi:hypothetical protein